MLAKILVVDDSNTDRIIIKNMLRDFIILTACDGMEAMEQIDMHPDIDLIILDLNMPKMDGFQVLNALNSREKYQKLRTIILTNYDEIDKEINGLKLGAIDYIRKPIHLESLRARIEIHLKLIKVEQLLEQKLDESNLTLETILNQAPIGMAIFFDDMFLYNKDDALPIINPMLEQITGRTKEEILRLGWTQITHPEDIQKDIDEYQKFLNEEIYSYNMETRYIKPDGSVVWVELIVAPIKIINNAKFNHICLVQDISERKAIEKAIYEIERSKAVLLSNLPGMAYRCNYDKEWTMQFVSQGCFKLTGYRSESLVFNRDLSFNDLILPGYRDSLWNEWNRILTEKLPFEYEYEIIAATGQRRWVLEMGQGVYDDNGNVETLEGIIIDITERKEQEIKLKHISEIDALTGLHNRRYLENVLTSDAVINKKNKRAVVLLNLRKFSTISLTYGYNFCETLIKELTASLSLLANDKHELFQISFERFAFYFDNYKNNEELKEFCNRIIDALSKIEIMHTIGCGIGVLEINECSCDAESIIRNASTAAERSDESHIFVCRFFDNVLHAEIIRETEIKEALMNVAKGTTNDFIYLKYQPIIDLKTDRIDGFEALVRLKSEKLGVVSPVEFIPILEETQLIVPIGKKITYMACVFLKKLETLGFDNLNISVNISALQLIRDEFLPDLLHIIEDTKINTNNLGLELTESIFSSNYIDINEKLVKLKENGIKISIDDFGTGYSSLARERELNVNCLKIDKYFIDKLLSVDAKDTITGDIISMAHKLGHFVVAEGVECENQKQYLIEHNCDMMQGYLFSKPLDEEAAIDLLIKQS